MCYKKLFSRFILIAAMALPSLASADWSWNLGYHNPPSSTLGINFMHLWTNWALELGVGWINVNTTDKNSTTNDGSNTSLHVAGDFNMKYLFRSGWFRPYLQAGLGVSTVTSVGDNSGLGAGAGGPFAGAGIFLKGSPFYVYGSIVVGNGSTFQAGLGFDF